MLNSEVSEEEICVNIFVIGSVETVIIMIMYCKSV